ncbi:MAG: thiamine pyrophosphate-binding protein [Desulfoprunum sp.]|nr:thiamine pyrophosphate-binding protein [Desulfoprunum sp.]
MDERQQIGEYLSKRLAELGVRHIFARGGDDSPGIYDLLGRSAALKVINTRDEQGAGFAADAYARTKGLGAVYVASGPGALKIVNTTALASAEKSPVIVISGTASFEEQGRQQLGNRQSNALGMQKRIFEEFTVAATVIDSAETALAEIDRVLAAALRYQRPVYIELPSDLASGLCPSRHKPLIDKELSDPDTLQEAIDETTGLINAARRPVILAGVEIRRFNLQKELCQLAGKTGIPVATTLLAKSVIADTEKFSMGMYGQAIGLDKARSSIESSDCLLFLGTFVAGPHSGFATTEIKPNASLYATAECISIGPKRFENILFHDFIKGLIKAPISPRKLEGIPRPRAPRPFLHGAEGEMVTVAHLLQQINALMDDQTLIVADLGGTLIAAADLFIRHTGTFLSTALSASPGFAVPAALGAQLANPTLRPVVLVTDEAFQMTGMETSTIARYGLNPIIIVLNTQGYATGPSLVDAPYPWHFSKIPSVLGKGIGFIVATEIELEQALLTAKKNTESFTIIDVMLDRHAHNRLRKKLGKHGQIAKPGKRPPATGKKQD